MVGAALIRRALHSDETESIYAVVRPVSRNIYRIPTDDRVHLIECPMERFGELAGLIHEKCDTFYHLAWPRTATYQESLEDLRNKSDCIAYEITAVEQAVSLGCSRFIGAGSQSEYGIVQGKMSPTLPCNPVRADGVIHLAAGRLAEIAAMKAGIVCIWMRIFSVYGRYDRKNSLVSSTIDKLMRGQHCSFTPSEQIWDYLYEEDIGNAFYLAGKNIKKSGVYCVGSGDERKLGEYLMDIRDVVNPSAELGIGEIPYPTDPVMYLSADIRALSRDTGWVPHIKFKDGIRRILEYKKAGNV